MAEHIRRALLVYITEQQHTAQIATMQKAYGTWADYPIDSDTLRSKWQFQNPWDEQPKT